MKERPSVKRETINGYIGPDLQSGVLVKIKGKTAIYLGITVFFKVTTRNQSES